MITPRFLQPSTELGLTPRTRALIKAKQEEGSPYEIVEDQAARHLREWKEPKWQK